MFVLDLIIWMYWILIRFPFPLRCPSSQSLLFVLLFWLCVIFGIRPTSVLSFVKCHGCLHNTVSFLRTGKKSALFIAAITGIYPASPVTRLTYPLPQKTILFAVEFWSVPSSNITRRFCHPLVLWFSSSKNSLRNRGSHQPWPSHCYLQSPHTS